MRSSKGKEAGRGVSVEAAERRLVYPDDDAAGRVSQGSERQAGPLDLACGRWGATGGFEQSRAQSKKEPFYWALWEKSRRGKVAASFQRRTSKQVVLDRLGGAVAPGPWKRGRSHLG